MNILRFSGSLLKTALLSLILMAPNAPLAFGNDSFSVLLKDKNELVRAEAIRAFRASGPFSDQNVRLLTEALQDPSDLVRRETISTLESLGSKAEIAVPGIIKFLSTVEPGNLAQIHAPLALKSIGLNNEAVISKLKNLIQSQNSDLLPIRINSMVALGELKGNPETIGPILENICQNDSEHQALRLKCWAALARVLPDHTQAVGELVEMVKGKYGEIVSAYTLASGLSMSFLPRRDALITLSDLGKIDLVVPILIAELKNAPPREKERTIRNLQVINPTAKPLRKMLPHLKQYIESGNIKDAQIKFITLVSIARIGGPVDGKAILKEVLKNSNDVQIKSFTTQILEKFK